MKTTLYTIIIAFFVNSANLRFLGFLIGCIGVRSLLTYLSYKLNNKYLPYIAIVTLLIGLGFIRIYVFNLRKTGPETRGKEIWWDMLRPIHAFFYLYFTYLYFSCSYFSCSYFSYSYFSYSYFSYSYFSDSYFSYSYFSDSFFLCIN